MSKKGTNQWLRDRIHEEVGGKYTKSKLSKETCIYVLLESRGISLTWFNMVNIHLRNLEGEVKEMLAHEFQFDYVYNSEPPRRLYNEELSKIYDGIVDGVSLIGPEDIDVNFGQ